MSLPLAAYVRPLAKPKVAEVCEDVHDEEQEDSESEEQEGEDEKGQEPIEPAAKTQFLGTCFRCQVVGHKAVECPQLECFYCHELGHMIKDCGRRLQSRARTPGRHCYDSCQLCGAEGVQLKNCLVCAPLLNLVKNSKEGN